MGSLIRWFDIELAGEPVWIGAGLFHNGGGVSIEHLPIRLKSRTSG
jgi:hypothetical protein